MGPGSAGRLCVGVQVWVPVALLAFHSQRLRLLQISGTGKGFVCLCACLCVSVSVCVSPVNTEQNHSYSRHQDAAHRNTQRLRYIYCPMVKGSLCRIQWYLMVELTLPKHEREPVVTFMGHKNTKGVSLSSLGYCKKNMVASVERSSSWCKDIVFTHKGSVLRKRKQQFRWNTPGVFYIQFLPIDPFHLNLLHCIFFNGLYLYCAFLLSSPTQSTLHYSFGIYTHTFIQCITFTQGQ